jgi:hypothetical protein
MPVYPAKRKHPDYWTYGRLAKDSSRLPLGNRLVQWATEWLIIEHLNSSPVCMAQGLTTPYIKKSYA